MLIASFRGDLAQVRDLQSGEPLLHLAVKSKHIETVRLLLDSGRIGVDATDLHGGTALIPALLDGNRPMVELLVEKMHALAPHAINLANQTGLTPLMGAAASGQHEVVRLLLAKGAYPFMHVPDGHTALTLAVENWRRRLARPDTAPEKLEAAMLTAVALTELAPHEKFKFHYQTTTLQEKMLEEDRFAQQVIHSERSKAAVFSVARAAVHFFKQNGLIVDVINEWKNERINFYPLLRMQFADEAHLTNFIQEHASGTTEHGHVKLLALLWYLPRGFPSPGPDIWRRIYEIDSLYKHVLGPTRDYIQARIGEPEVSSRFGNASVLHDACFADKDFHPFHRALDYIRVNEESHAPVVRNYLDKGKPYISGLSGMMNLTARLLEFLGLHPRDPEVGVPFIEAMAAFIVGSGMHSYPEVYRSANLYQKLLKARGMLTGAVA